MPEGKDIIRVLGLTKLDVRELQQELGEAARIDSESITADKAGEPATFFAVVVLSALAIKGISLWLMRQITKAEVEFSVETQSNDGTFERRVARIVFSSSSPPPAEVIEKVGAVLKADECLINEAKKLIES